MNETTRSATNIVFLATSFVLGAFAVAICVVARNFFMNSPANWFTFDYSVTGWVLRLLSVVAGVGALLVALLARRGSHKRVVQRFVYRTDVALALIGIAFEIAIPTILFLLIIGFIGDAVSRSVESHSLGCLGGGFDFFDFSDSDD